MQCRGQVAQAENKLGRLAEEAEGKVRGPASKLTVPYFSVSGQFRLSLSILAYYILEGGGGGGAFWVFWREAKSLEVVGYYRKIFPCLNYVWHGAPACILLCVIHTVYGMEQYCILCACRKVQVSMTCTIVYTD